jgi:hypothetical protein
MQTMAELFCLPSSLKWPKNKTKSKNIWLTNVAKKTMAIWGVKNII